LSRIAYVAGLAGLAGFGLALPGLANAPLDPPLPAAFEPVRLLPTPTSVASDCRRVQARARGTVMCPRVLPRAILRDLGLPPAVVRTFSTGWGGGPPTGLDIAYGGPWEPGNPGWQRHLWRNRPCCFLHFEVYQRPHGPRSIPSTARPATLGKRRGLLKPAAGYGRNCRGDSYLYWCNHVAFLWREAGTSYVATLHTFGPGTVHLLGRLVASLSPAGTLPRSPRRGVAVGVSPNAIETQGSTLWVAAFGDRTGKLRGTISRIDVKTARVRAQLSAGPGARGLALDGDAIWTVTYDRLVRLDARTGERVAVVDTGRWPRAVAVGAGGVWVVNSAPFATRGSLVRVDPSTNRTSGPRVTLGRAPVALAVANDALWIADELDGILTRVDPSEMRVVARIKVGRGPTGVAASAGSIWVANTGDGTVSRVDPATNRVTATIHAGLAPRGIIVANGSVWVAVTGNGTVLRIKSTTNRASVVARGLGDPLAVAVASGRLWVTTNSDGRLLSLPQPR
jgi:YVTN family beta-propeller protein